MCQQEFHCLFLKGSSNSDRQAPTGDETSVNETPWAREIFIRLKNGEPVSDLEFDEIFPDQIRKFSDMHWTPVAIAKRAAELLVEDSNTRILDVGSGCGKFCLVGGLTTSGNFYGIEQRENLASFGRSLVHQYDIERVQFTAGDLKNIDWGQFHGFYLYNPFIENLYAKKIRIDDKVELNEERYLETVRWVQMQLHLLPVGTRVVTYHGFGGEMPPTYDLKLEEQGDGDFIRLWIKAREHESAASDLE